MLVIMALSKLIHFNNITFKSKERTFVLDEKIIIFVEARSFECTFVDVDLILMNRDTPVFTNTKIHLYIYRKST